MIIIRRMVSGITEHFGARISEWAMAYATLGWGLSLLQKGDVFKASPVWNHMANIFSENTWGWIAVVIGSTRFAALIVNGTFYRTWWGRWSPHVRAILSTLSCGLWVQVYIGHMSSGVTIPALSLYGAALGLCAANAYRAAMDAGATDREARRGD